MLSSTPSPPSPLSSFCCGCCCLVLKSCGTLCDPMDGSPPGSSVHGISQARILEWVAISFSRGPSQPRDQILISCLAGGFFTTEPPGKARPLLHISQLETNQEHQLGFPASADGKESTCNAEDPHSILGLGRSTGEGIGYPLQHSGLENSVDCIVHAVTKSRTRLSDFHFHKNINTI